LEEITHELAPKVVVHLPKLFGIDMSLTTHTIWLFIAMIVAFLFIYAGARRVQLVPRGVQNVVESLLDFVRNGMIDDIIGPEGRGWFPFIATLFIFILFANMLGLIPGAKTATSITGTTAAWAIIVFIAYNYIGVRKKGPVGYLKSFVPHGVPAWLAPIMFVLELVSHLLRPFSLAVRLFANMVAGHLVLAIFTLFAMQIAFLPLKGLPLVAVVIVLMFEIFVAAIQAYIFAVLAAIYIGGALSEEH